MSILEGVDVRTGELVRVTTARGIITDVEPLGTTAGGEPWVAPGLVDLQINGYLGFDFNGDDLDPDGVRALTDELRTRGVLTYIPTLVTAPEDELIERLAAIARARTDSAVAAAIPYVHIEGPFISDQEGPRGAHRAEFIREPSIREVAEWQRAGGGLVGMVTLSPHWAGSADVIRSLRADGIHVAIGHTHASPEQIHEAVGAGATLSTHLGNGTHATLPRHPNYLWAQLAEERLAVGLIADRHHLDVDTLVAIIRSAGVDRVHLVSDSVAIGGMPAGQYRSIGFDVDLSADGRVTQIGTPYLAGAALNLNEGVATAAQLPGLHLRDAIQMATANPARFLPAAASPLGVLEVGARADLMQFSFTGTEPSLTVHATEKALPG